MLNMASTYAKLQYHLVFSTKNRDPSIQADWETYLFAYLNGCLRQVGCIPLEIGGHSDHVHILTGMRPTHRVCDVVCDIKSASSRWVHDTLRLDTFAWQEGYGAFTASARDVEGLRQYIQTQREHHRGKTFLEEYMEFLEEAGIDWDPRYLG
jgi:REP element-mobilizing transposase RayT